MPAKKTEKKSIVRISLTKPAARDEGPRLLPSNGKHNDTSLGKGEYYVQLAETLLHPETQELSRSLYLGFNFSRRLISTSNARIMLVELRLLTATRET